jgi:hypothetical protein
MARTPFIDLPDGCPPLSFDVDITPSDFTMCTVPEVTFATQMPLTFHIDVPDLVVPPFCACIPTQHFSRSDYTIKLHTQMAGLYYTLRPITEDPDCCDPDFTMNFSLAIPCMPLDTESTGTIRVTQAKKAEASIGLARLPSTCVLKFEYDIAVPCMPLTMTSTGTIRTTQSPHGDVSLRITKQETTCAYDFDLDIRIPCNPFSIKPTGTARFTQSTDDLHVSYWFSKRPDTCILELDEIEFGFDIKIPCHPFSMKATGTAELTHISRALLVTTEPSMAMLSMWFSKVPDTCILQVDELKMHYDMKIPCIPFTLKHTGTAWMGGGTDELDITMRLTALNDCTLKLEYSVNVPCSPVYITEVDNVEPPGLNGLKETVLFTMYMDADCTMKWGIALERIGFDGDQTYAKNIRWYSNCLQWRYGIKYYKDGRCYSLYQDAAWYDLICATSC